MTPGGVFQISNDGDDRMGAKIKTPKNPWTKHAKQVWLYFIRRTTWPGYVGTTTNLQIVLNAQKNPY